MNPAMMARKLSDAAATRRPMRPNNTAGLRSEKSASVQQVNTGYGHTGAQPRVRTPRNEPAPRPYMGNSPQRRMTVSDYTNVTKRVRPEFLADRAMSSMI